MPEVPSEEPGVRICVVQRDERLADERAQRLNARARVPTALEGLQRRVEHGRRKAPEQIGAAARMLARHHGHRDDAWHHTAGPCRCFVHPVNLAREEAAEGQDVIHTEAPGLTSGEAVQSSKSRSEVERAFRRLKEVSAMRPISHHTDARVEAHRCVAA